MKEFQSRLRAIRTGLLKLSQPEFAEKIGVAGVTVRAWETGKTRITPNFLQKLITELSRLEVPVSKDWLLTGEGISPFDRSLFNNTKISEKDIFLSLNPGAILFEIQDSSYEPLYYKGDIVGAFPIEAPSISSMSYTLIDIDSKRREIRKSIFTEDNQLILLPFHPESGKKAVVFEASMSTYKIIWFKGQKNQKP